MQSTRLVLDSAVVPIDMLFAALGVICMCKKLIDLCGVLKVSNSTDVDVYIYILLASSQL
jgi:hypothetical protein